MRSGTGWEVEEGRREEKPRSMVCSVRRRGETRMMVFSGLRDAKKVG
jgi:hypothetical protein